MLRPFLGVLAGSSAPLYSVGYTIASRLTLFAMNMLAAGLLLPADYGFFSYLLITAAGVSVMSSLGVGVTCNTVTSRHYDTDPDRVSATVTLSMIGNAALALVLSFLFAAPVGANPAGLDYTSLVGLIFGVSVLLTSYGAIQGVFHGLGWQRQMFLTAAAVSVVAVAASAGLMWAIGLTGAIIALVLYRLAALAAFMAKLRISTRVRFSLPSLVSRFGQARSAFLRISVPLAVASAISGPVISFCLAAVQAEGDGFASIAGFAFLYQFYLVIFLVSASLAPLFVSKIASASEFEGRAMARTFVMLGGAIGLAGSLAFAVLGAISPLLFPQIDLEPDVVLQMAAATFLMSISYPLSSYWPAVGLAYYAIVAQFFWSITMVLVLWSQDASTEALSTAFLVAALAHACTNAGLFMTRRSRLAR